MEVDERIRQALRRSALTVAAFVRASLGGEGRDSERSVALADIEILLQLADSINDDTEGTTSSIKVGENRTP